MAKISDKHLMDRKFLEFWGNLFLNIAKGQEHMDQLSSIMNMDSMNNMDFMNFNEMAKIFRQSYQLASEESSRPDRKPDEKDALKPHESFEAFQKAFADSITLWGWIPKKDHDALKQSYDGLKIEYETLQNENNDLRQKHDVLKQKADTQEEVISQLRDILNAKGMGHVELFQHIQNLARKQTNEFQSMILNLQSLFKTDDNNPQL
ncbi:MAG: hypothetical protein HQK61_05270 [Desulfamplus sp.]|nr:hypothetical protein [Desulfamplus sp.]